MLYKPNIMYLPTLELSATRRSLLPFGDSSMTEVQYSGVRIEPSLPGSDNELLCENPILRLRNCNPKNSLLGCSASPVVIKNGDSHGFFFPHDVGPQDTSSVNKCPLLSVSPSI